MSRRLALYALPWPALRLFVAGGLAGYGLAQPVGAASLWALAGVFWLFMEGVGINCRYRRRQIGHENAQATLSEALATAQRRFEAIIDGMPAAVFVADLRQDEILFANRSFTQMLGADIVGRSASSLLWPHLHGEHHTFDAARIEAGTLPAELFASEMQYPLTGRWYVVHERAVRWTDGRVVRLGVLNDVTDRRHSEEVTREQAERMQHAWRLVMTGEMASSMAHELNQPLAAISFYCTGCVTLLQNGNYLNSRRELLSAMQKARLQAERASRLLRRMLDLVKKHRPRPEALSLPQVLADTLALFEFDERRGAGRVCLDVAGDLPAVCADRIQLEQVLTNLIRNAFEAMAGLPVEERIVQVRAREEAEPRAGWVRIEIVDRGTGIAPEQWPLLFSSFYSTRQAGLGMGLNVCRTIVESYGSSLSVANNISGGGCTFAFSMPGAIHDGRS